MFPRHSAYSFSPHISVFRLILRINSEIFIQGFDFVMRARCAFCEVETVF
jgi:hypothetical protein